MDNDTDVFWMVWSPQGDSPTVRHATSQKAATEAGRLAHCHPGKEFYVLEATESFVVGTLRRTRLTHPIPF